MLSLLGNVPEFFSGNIQQDMLIFNSVFFQYYTSLPPGMQRKAVAQPNCYSPLKATETTTTKERKQRQTMQEKGEVSEQKLFVSHITRTSKCISNSHRQEGMKKILIKIINHSPYRCLESNSTTLLGHFVFLKAQQVNIKKTYKRWPVKTCSYLQHRCFRQTSQAQSGMSWPPDHQVFLLPSFLCSCYETHLPFACSFFAAFFPNVFQVHFLAF